MIPMSWAVDRPILSTTTVGFIARYPRAAPSRVSARAANGSASASARSASATAPGAAPSLPRWPLSRRRASGSANRSMPAVHASDTTTTGMTAARRMAETRSSWPRWRSRAMKLTSPTHAPSPAADSTIRNREIAVKKAPATGLVYSRVMTTVSTRVVTAATKAPIRFSALPRATSFSRGPGWPESPACHGQRRRVWRGGRHHEPGSTAGIRIAAPGAGPGTRRASSAPGPAAAASCRLARAFFQSMTYESIRKPSGDPVAV